jgi:transcriptional regulator with XRE-family HTH domain
LITTYPTITGMGRQGGGSLSGEFRAFKRRLKWVLQNTAETQDEIAQILTERHAPVSRSTVSRWMQDDDDGAPDQLQMLALMKSHLDISTDWLFGRKPAESIAEKFIESRI